MISSIDFVIIIIVAIILLNGITCPVAPSKAAINISVNNTNENLFPSVEINAVLGEDIYIKILQPVTDQTDCLYRKTGGQDVSIRTPNKPK